MFCISFANNMLRILGQTLSKWDNPPMIGRISVNISDEAALPSSLNYAEKYGFNAVIYQIEPGAIWYDKCEKEYGNFVLCKNYTHGDFTLMLWLYRASKRD